MNNKILALTATGYLELQHKVRLYEKQLVNAATQPIPTTPNKTFDIALSNLEATNIVAMDEDNVNRLVNGFDVSFTKDNVAIVNVNGVFKRYTDWFERNWFGYFSTHDLSNTIRSIMRNTNNKGVVLKIYSPGGHVDGTKDLINAINSLQVNKPIVSVIEMAASAAAWLAGSTDYCIASSQLSTCGSIGVYTTHIDDSSFLESIGIKVTYITATKSTHKLIGVDGKPLSEEELSKITSDLDAINNIMQSDIRRKRNNVLSGRSGNRTLDEDTAFNAQTLTARDARRIGLIDEIATDGNPIPLAVRRTVSIYNKKNTKK